MIVAASAVGVGNLPRWVIRSELDLGRLSDVPAEEFYRVSDVRLLADGQIAVVNRGTSEVRFFDQAGRLVEVVGKDGDGPREFRAPIGLRRIRGDSLVVVDRELRRLTILAPDHKIVRTARLEGDLATIDFVGASSPDELVIQNTAVRAPRGPGAEDNPTTLIEYDLDGHQLRGLGTYPAMQWVRLGSNAITRPQFGPTSTFVAVAGGVWIGLAREYEVVRADTLGRALILTRWSGADLAVEDADRERWRASVLKWADTEEGRQMAEEQLRVTVYAERKAAYSRVVARDDGGVWIREYAPFSPDSVSWLVLNRNGRPEGLVRTEAGLRVLDVRGHEIAGVMADTLGVEHVIRGRVTPDS